MKTIEKCLLCGETSSSSYYDYGAPDKIKVYNRICNNCGLVFQSPRLEYAELKEYYSSYIQITQPEIADIPISIEEHILAISRLRLKFIKQFLKDDYKILDIGCSFGAMLKVLKDESGFNLNLKGVNPEASFALFGREKYGLDIRIGMFEEQNFEPLSFDLIILDNVLEHFDNPRKSIKDIYTLLAEDGRLFIATNNLDEPHGFLWQNFFPDHTVTFSSDTLKSLLEAEGFNVIKQDFSGHITYEGYHYPYQYCIAIKTKVPDSYNFRINKNLIEKKSHHAKGYKKNYMKNNGLAKRIYELELIKNPSLKNMLQKKVLYTFGKIIGKPVQFQIYNHTLPPEEYFYRRVLVAICQTKEDESLALKMSEISKLNPEIFLLRKQSDQKLALRSYPKSFFKSPHQSKFATVKEFWVWLLDNSPRIDTGISLQLYKADLKKDVLIRAYKKFYNTDKVYAVVDFRQFTSALLEFHDNKILNEISKYDNQDINLLPVFEKSKLNKNYMLIWPEKEDFDYYYKENFSKYFKLPKSISLDLSPACNKVCDKCQFHSPKSPYANLIKRGEIMPKELAYRILNEASSWNPKPSIATSFSGEPLIYPYLFDVLKHAKNLGFNVSITTNGAALTENVIRKIIDLGIDSVIVSLDTLDDEIYSLLQSPGKLSQVKNNILRLVNLRKPGKPPFIGLHFTMEERNKNEFEKYLDFWGDKVDSVSRTIQQNQFAACQCVLPLWFPVGKKQACHSAWNNLYIRWNGDISFCGFDIDGKTSKLNICNKSLIEIWNSKEFWGWREALLNNDFSLLYCKACPDWSTLRSSSLKEGSWQIIRTAFTEVYTPINSTT